MLLRFVLFAYLRGIVSSRAIKRDCRTHMTFDALSGDTCPQLPTIATLILRLYELIDAVFKQVELGSIS